MNTKFSVTSMWDSRTINAQKESRIMLCVTINRERFKVSMKFYSTKSDYDKALGGRSLNDSQKNLKTGINLFISKAESLLERLAEPSKESFLRFYKSDMNLSNGSKVDVYALFKAKYVALNNEERFGSAECVNNALCSLKAFKRDLFLEDIDERFLKSYREWMLKRGRSATTIGIYLRNLRAVYNQALDDGLISDSKKPFKNVPISGGVKSKSVLYAPELELLWKYRSKSIRDQRAIAFFFFCYLGNGMNPKDMLNLKFCNIKGDVLSFNRQKTKRTKNNQTEIRVHLHDTMKKIIDLWGNKLQHPDNYIFPLMSKYRDEKHFNDTLIRYKRTANKSLARIGQELGFDVHLCLNLARHSFATKQKIDGTNPFFIKDAMGHGSLATTEHYLKSLPDANLKQLNSNLMNFK